MVVTLEHILIECLNGWRDRLWSLAEDALDHVVAMTSKLRP